MKLEENKSFKELAQSLKQFIDCEAEGLRSKLTELEEKRELTSEQEKQYDIYDKELNNIEKVSDKLEELIGCYYKYSINNLPDKVELSVEDLPDYICEEIEQFISDFLADNYGYCNSGFSTAIKIDVDGINWDIDEDLEEE